MPMNDVEKGAVSIALMNDNQQQKKAKTKNFCHGFKKWFTDNYLIGVSLPIFFIIVIIILILLFRESSRRCSIFADPHQCEEIRFQSN